MMTLDIIGSSSHGNGYALSNGKEILLIEAGIKFKTMLKAIDYKLPLVVGCLVSHAHNDHAKYATEYAKYGISVVINRDVESKKNIPRQMCKVTSEAETLQLGSFRVTPFHVAHDVPNFGYLVYQKEMGTLLFATDTFTLPYKFKNINHFLIEANYDDNILGQNVSKGLIDKKQADRLMVSHMSLANCIGNLKQCHAEHSSSIVLIHLSERNSSPKMFHDRLAAAFGVPTYIASKGKKINLSRYDI